MGWLHVAKTGKGVTLGYDEAVPMSEAGIAKYVLSKKDAENIVGKELPHYEELTPLHKAMVVSRDRNTYRWSLEMHDPAEYTDWDFDGISEDDAKSLFIGSLSVLFEHHYGYPSASFRSVSDYNGTAMLYCDVAWPPEEYNQALANMTENSLIQQLREFVVDVTGKNMYQQLDLEICEEYIKE